MLYSYWKKIKLLAIIDQNKQSFAIENYEYNILVLFNKIEIHNILKQFLTKYK